MIKLKLNNKIGQTFLYFVKVLKIFVKAYFYFEHISIFLFFLNFLQSNKDKSKIIKTYPVLMVVSKRFSIDRKLSIQALLLFNRIRVLHQNKNHISLDFDSFILTNVGNNSL